MQEFADGAYGPVEQADALLRRLAETGITRELSAIHFGARDELEALRCAPREPKGTADPAGDVDDLRARLADLEARVNAATADQHRTGVRVYPADALDAIPARLHQHDRAL